LECGSVSKGHFQGVSQGPALLSDWLTPTWAVALPEAVYLAYTPCGTLMVGYGDKETFHASHALPLFTQAKSLQPKPTPLPDWSVHFL